MKITKKDIEYLGKLAKLRISSEESDQYQKEISDILEYADKITKVRCLEELYSPREESWLRTDNVESDNLSNLMQNVPEVEDGHIKVKAVLDTTNE